MDDGINMRSLRRDESKNGVLATSSTEPTITAFLAPTSKATQNDVGDHFQTLDETLVSVVQKGLQRAELIKSLD